MCGLLNAYSKKEHVLYGERSSDTRATGGHSTNSGSVQVAGQLRVSSNGVREALVDIDGVRKSNNGGVSTLFLADCSDDDIMREFSEGIKSGARRHEDGYVVRTPSGVNIQFYTRSDGKIKTFFPIFED